MEAEARDSSDQLREMAEKVFQLLERLKLVRGGCRASVCPHKTECGVRACVVCGYTRSRSQRLPL